MSLLLLSFFAGMLTLLSPCILPVLPFVFARADRPFVRSTLPLLAGMALTFTVVASLAAVGSQWVGQANQIGRWIALLLMALFALALLWPRLADHLLAPLQRLGARLGARADAATANGRGGGGTSLLIGIATGLLWAPCAGPILGLVLTGAALNGASASSTGLLLAYAAGAACALALAVWAGGRSYRWLQARLGWGDLLRRALGAAALLAVLAIAMGWDTGLLTRLSTVGTTRLEQRLIDTLPAGDALAPPPMMARGDDEGGALPVLGQMPSLQGASGWLNSPPLDVQALRGKVVLVDFWTYSCINCLRAMPFVHEWERRYRDHGLVVIGVHTPEFAFERNPANVMKAVESLQVRYPVALDNRYAIWRGFSNRYWPAYYFVDAQRRIRAHQFGEGNQARSERIIRQLLAEAGHTGLPPPTAATAASLSGVEMQADVRNLRSPETYLGTARAENFTGTGALRAGQVDAHALPDSLALNQWGLQGAWRADQEAVQLQRGPGRIAFQFHARDLHLVLAPGSEGTPVRFRVWLDGKPLPAADAGSDVDAQGHGRVDEHRLYQLVRQRGAIGPHRFEIEFLDPGVHAYAFTFG